MDIKQQIKEYLEKEGKTLTGLVNLINSFKSPDEQTTVQNISNKLSRGTIKYNEVLEIAQILGYNLVWEKQKSNEVNLSAFKFEDIIDNDDRPSQTGVNYTKLKENPRSILVEQEVHRFYSKLLLFLTNYTYAYNLEEYIKRNLGIASISFNTIPLHSFIFGHTNFLCEALSYTPFGNDFIPTLNYIQNIYYHGKISDLNTLEQQNLINSFEYFNVNYFTKTINQKID
jgi:hypothetical protein